MSAKNPTATTRQKKATSPEAKTAQKTSVPVAVIGIGCLFPGSKDKQGYWRDIVEGQDRVTEVPPTHFFIEDFYDPDPFKPDKTYCRRGAFLSPVEFDPMAFGVPPTNLAATDTSQLLSLVVAKQVLSDAFGGKYKDIDRDRVSVILGVAAGLELLGEMACRLARPTWVKAMREEGLPEDEVESICDRILANCVAWKESTFPGLLGNVVSGRIANHFDLNGINCTSDAACASSFSALSQGLAELYLRTSDVVIVGGADTNNDPFLFVSFSKTPALSPTSDCRPFSDKADGMVLGEGIGMVALKRLDEAERDGDRIYAVIQGLGAASDGSGTSIYAPLPEGQARALRRCYQQAPYGPETVELVEAHGTGTMAGDKTEVQGLTKVFDEETGRKDRQWCALGSVKSQIGHTKSTAAAAGLIKAVLGLRHKVLPPTIKVERPDPKLSLEKSAFYLNTESRPWVRDASHPRRASVSSFGFGGTNFHTTVEEYRGPGKKAYRLRTVPTELVVLSATDAKALERLCREIEKDLDVPGMLPYLARSSQENFDPSLPAKLSIVAKSEADTINKLNYAAFALSDKPDIGFALPNGVYCSVHPPESGKIAFLFPGQGASLYRGMGADLAMHFDEAMAIWDEVTTLEKQSGVSELLHRVVFPLPAFSKEDREAQAAKMARTEWSQPAIMTTSLSFSSLLKSVGIRPDMVGGHSLGEISALHDAGVLDLDSLLKICRRRGELMGKASKNPGTMTAVMGELKKVEAIVGEIGKEVVIANYNSPSQLVLSGTVAGIEAAEKAFEKASMKFKRLPVTTPFHSPMMSEAPKPFHDTMKGFEFRKPRMPIYSNVLGDVHSDKPEEIRRRLAEQIDSPVQFVKQVQAMHAAGARTFIEVGPGAVLTTFVGKILEGKPHTAVSMDTKGEHGVTGFQKALGQLAAFGVTPDFQVLWEDYAPIEDPRELDKPKFAVSLLGCNYGRTYPPPGGYDALPKPNPPGARPQKALVDREEDEVPEEEAPRTAPVPAPRAAAPAPAPVAYVAPALPAAPPLPVAPIAVAPAAQPRVPRTDSAWLGAFQEIQRQTAEAHASYQKAMADSHLSFLKTAERSNLALEAMLSSGKLPAQTGQPAYEPIAPLSRPIAPPPLAAVVPPPAPAPIAVPVPVAIPAPAPAAPPAPVAAAAPAAPAIPANIDFKEMLLDVVAEKTGYPKEILNPDMSLEADLGIDSIKRVEIFSAVKDKNPWLPEVDPAVIGTIKTLRDVIAFIEKNAGSMAASAAAARPAPAAPSAPPASAAAPAAARPAIPANIDFKAMLLDVVAEKTGYPKEILNPDMSLEADLGIDSIKRVEIFSAVKDKNPWLPEVDPAVIGTIKTLRDVIAFIEKNAGSVASAAPAASPAAAAPAAPGALAPATSPPGGAALAIPKDVDFKAMLLDVVAEKTGYPKEILNLEMGLESDLGIDSIKRVEIFSAVKDTNPWLPEVDPAVIGTIKTLGDVVRYIENQLASVQSGAPAPGAPSAQPAPAEVPAEKKRPGIGRYGLRVEPAPPAGFAMRRLFDCGPVAIIDDGNGVAPALADGLKKNQIEAAVVTDIPESCGGLVFLGGLREIADRDEAVAVNLEAFLAARKLAPRLGGDTGGLFVTVQNTGGDFGLSGNTGPRLFLGGLAGLVKTASIEWPNASVKAIDVDPGRHSAKKVAEAILNEMLGGGPELEVGLKADGSRVRLRSVEAPLKASAPAIDESSVIVASGGARGVTAKSLIALAKARHPRLALLGRTELVEEPECCRGAANDAEVKRALLEEAKATGRSVTPMALGKTAQNILAVREIRANLKAIEEAGSQVLYLVADIQNAEDVGRALETVRSRFGAVTGVVHGAGVLADKLIAEKTVDQFNLVFNTKVDGLDALLQATAKDPLKVICLFSSIAGRTGNMGQSDYAMANEVLNKAADAEAAERRGKCLVKSINWGPWDGGMVSPLLRSHFESMGVPLIPPDVGVDCFVQELCEGAPEEVEIVIGPRPPEGVLAISPVRREVQLGLAVTKERFPFIESHRIQNTAVVPAALVLEWFARAARLFRPDLRPAAVRDLKVLRGVRLSEFGSGMERLAVRCRELSGGDGSRLALELPGANGIAQYTAEIDMAAAGATTGASEKASLNGLSPWRWGVADIYKTMLFHGPQFQVIRTLEGVSAEAATAVLDGTRAMSWPGDPWEIDVAAIDGGLQLAILWGLHNLDKRSLPTRIGACQCFRPGAVTGPLRCELRGKVMGGNRTLSDIAFFDEQGVLVSKLTGVEMHALPEGKDGEKGDR